MKKKLSLLFLTLTLLAQPIYAGIPSHSSLCNCGECIAYDKIYAPFFDGVTDVILDSMSDYLTKPNTQNNPISNTSLRWIPETFPERENYFRYNLPDYLTTTYCTSIDWIESGYKGIDAVILNLYNSLIRRKDSPVDSINYVQGLNQIHNEYFANSSTLLNVFEKNSVWSKEVTLKDMMHIPEALSNGTNLLALEVNPIYIPDLILNTNGEVVQEGKKYIEGAPIESHTVIVCGVGVKNEEIYIYLLDPYNTKSIMKVKQKDFYNATLGSGHNTMFVLDTNQ